MVIGNNGIVAKANESKIQMEIGEEKEQIILAMGNAQIGNTTYQEITQETLQKNINEQIGIGKVTISANGDKSFHAIFENTKREYEITSEREVILLDDIYYIKNIEELKKFRDEVNAGNTFEGKYVQLLSNIQLDINEEWEPIGTYLNSNTSVTDISNKPFKGVFDGKGHEITGMKITSEEKGKGFFGLINNGKVRNLGIGENCNIDAGVSVGAITGYLYNGAKASNCYNKATIQTTGTNTGGIVGTADSNSSIESCYNLGKVITMANNKGGIVGYASNNCSIVRCYNNAPVMEKEQIKNNIGGIAGSIYDSEIRESFNGKQGIVKGISNVGGITGIIVQKGVVRECYNMADITGSNYNIGGMVGYNQGDIKNCYGAGKIEGTGNLGGIVGFYEKGNVENCYYLENIVDSTKITSLEGVKMNTISELKKGYTRLGNKFKEDINNNNEGFPILTWQ